MANLGREFQEVYDPKGDFLKYTLHGSVQLPLSTAAHAALFGSTGSGKTWTTAVIIEETVKTAENEAILLIDPNSDYSMMDLPADPSTIKEWNAQNKGSEIKAQGMKNIEIWKPGSRTGDYQRFSLRMNQISIYMFCKCFDLGPMNPQTRLFRKARKRLMYTNPNFTLEDLETYISDYAESMHAQYPTIEALLGKLDALDDLELLTDEGTEISQIVRENRITVFNLSQQDPLVGKILVNFLVEQIWTKRTEIYNALQAAKRGIRVPIENYIPFVRLIVDEAHRYLPNNPFFTTISKEGRKYGVCLTAISQSADFDDDFFQNVDHLFVGAMNDEKQILKLKQILPVVKSMKSFNQMVKELRPGNFLYFNAKEKLFKKIRIRPRETFHPATSDIRDEKKLLNAKEKHSKCAFECPYEGEFIACHVICPEFNEIDYPEYWLGLNAEIDKEYNEIMEKIEKEVDKEIASDEIEESVNNKEMKFFKYFSKLKLSGFSSIRKFDQYQENQILDIMVSGIGKLGSAKIMFKHHKKLAECPDEFLCQDTDTKTRTEAIKILNSCYQKNPIQPEDLITIYRLEWIKVMKQNRNEVIQNA